MNTPFKLLLTPAAIAHIQTIMQKQAQPLGFRLSMRKYGCNGFGYVPEVISTLQPADVEVDATTDFRVFVDSEFLDQLNGTEVDYVVTGLGQSQLVFRNPNAEGECGCGESVNFKKQVAKD